MTDRVDRTLSISIGNGKSFADSEHGTTQQKLVVADITLFRGLNCVMLAEPVNWSNVRIVFQVRQRCGSKVAEQYRAFCGAACKRYQQTVLQNSRNGTITVQ